MTVRLTRSLGAVLLLAGGIIHFDLWKSGYRVIPKIGPLFLANFVGSVALAAIALATMSLLALVLSRTVGVLGFSEMIWTRPAIQTIASEIGVVLTLGYALFLEGRTRRMVKSSVRARAPY